MYSSYTAAALTLRAKLSLSVEKPDYCSNCCCSRSRSSDLSLYALHPKLLYTYYLRQSALIHWSPSRTLLSATSRYRALQVDASYTEVIGLLSDIECCQAEQSKFGGQEPRRGSRTELVRCRLLPRENADYTSGLEYGVRSRRSGRVHSAGYGRYEVDEEGEFEREIREDVGRDRSVPRKDYQWEGSGSRKRYVQDRREDCREVQEDRRNNWQKGSTDEFRKVQEDRRNNQRDYSSNESQKVQEDRRSNRQSYSNNKSQNVQEDRVNNSHKDFREGSQKVRFTSEVRENDTRASSLRDVVDARRSKRVVGSSKASTSSTKLGEVSVLNSSDTKRASDYRRYVGEAGLNDRVGTSTSGQYSNMASDRRVQMEQQSVDKSEVKQQYENQTNVTRNQTSDNVKRGSLALEVNQRYDNRTNITGNYANDTVSQGSSVIEMNQKYADHTNVARNHASDAVKQVTSDIDVNQRYKNRTNVTRNHASDTLKQGSSNFLADTRLSEQHSASSTSQLRVGNEQRNQYDESHSQQQTKLSELSRSEVEKISNSQQTSNTRIDRENYPTSTINVVHDRIDQQVQTENRIDQQYSSRRASETDARLSGVSSSEAERVSVSLGKPILRKQNQKESSSTMLVEGNKDRQSTLVGESSRASSGIFYGASSFSHAQIQALDDQTGRDETYQFTGNQLESASRLDKSSTMYVGEFVDKMRQEMSTSDELDNASRLSFEIQVEDVHGGTTQSAIDVNSNMLDAAITLKSETHKEGRSRQSSSTSGMKGPPDEMWDVRDPYSEEPSRPEEPAEDPSTMEDADPSAAHARTDNAITRRSHKSLWTYISDIIRANWVLRSGSPNPTLKSGKRSSSNDSVSSEAWFSPHEPDENDDGTNRKAADGMPDEPVHDKSPVGPSHERTQSARSQPSPEAPGPGDQIILSGTSSSFSKGSTRRGSPSKGASDKSKQEEMLVSEGEKGSLGISFSEAPIQKPSTPISSTVSSTIEDVILQIRDDRVQGSGSLELEGKEELTKETLPEVSGSEGKNGELNRRKFQRNKQVQKESFDEWEEAKEELTREKLPEVGGTVGKDGVLKQRKLQRNKQVLTESFDEWEEAYIRESELRKIDEFFMREALLEAKKAADAWEVPVGAVLVQNGKIIARGCNLVEEARDSTAHAEMICIREASTLLRTWRLSETTLYVTLEPCAMCAGAILQARIDTVVWGAPNKLLGADGSWVRLFPGGDGETNSLGQSSQIAGPVHPFHPKIVIRRGILATECSDAMQHFFQLRRKKKRVPDPERDSPSCLPISTHPTKFFSKMHDLFCIMFCL